MGQKQRTIYLNEYTNESITIVGNDNSVILGSTFLSIYLQDMI